MQYSIFTHGTAVEVEDPAALVGFEKVGWGTRILLKEPPLETVTDFDVRPEHGPGSWFHIPLTSTLTTFGRSNPFLVSVTLLIDTQFCRIKDVHVYDGAEIVQEFNNNMLQGELSYSRNGDDINPDSPPDILEGFDNTLKLDRPHKVFSAIGISFYATAYTEDYDENGYARSGRYPQAVLTVSGAGAQYRVADPPVIKSSLSDRISKVIDSFGAIFRP